MQACVLGERCDYEEIFVVETPDPWSWCLHCERTYPTGSHRHELDLWMCPYVDCGGDATMDRWQWHRVREFHPEYPEMPEPGVRYPIYS